METSEILSTEPPRRKTDRRLVIGIGAVAVLFVLGYGVHGCVRSLRAGQVLANSLVYSLHRQMENRGWDDLYENASNNYRSGESREKSNLLFSSIDRKLGTPGETKQLNIFLNVNTTRHYLRAVYDTNFSLGDNCTETIVWKQENGQYRLYSYFINSEALITK